MSTSSPPPAQRHGRRFVLLLSIALQTVFGVAVAFAPNFTVYVILRFVVGATISGVIINAFVLGTNQTHTLEQTNAARLEIAAVALVATAVVHFDTSQQPH